MKKKIRKKIVKDEFTEYLYSLPSDNGIKENKNDIVIDKEKIASEWIAENIARNLLAFPLEVLPNSFEKPKKDELEFIRKLIKRMNILKIKEYYNLNLNLELSCYLENTNVSIKDITNFIFSVLEGTVFKHRNQVKILNIKIIDVLKDRYNDKPYIGIVARRLN